jgi:thiaminase
LLQQYGINADNPYQKFFAFHASEEHLPGLQLSLDLLDRHAATSTEPQRQKMTTAFMISVSHETMLWDEYYNKVVWESY